MTRSQRLVLVIPVLLAGVLGAWWASWLLAPSKADPMLVHGTRLPASGPLDKVDLLDQQGKPFTVARFVGRWSIVYFGFTSCPMICPTTMVMLKEVAEQLKRLPGEAQPQVVMITVDPPTDTPEVMGRYVATFNPAFIGLSGSAGRLEDAAKQFSVAHSGANGTIDHSSTLYVVGPDGGLVAVFTPPQNAAGIAEDYRRLVGDLAGN